MPLDHKPLKVIAPLLLPSLYLMDGQCFNPWWSKGEVPNTLYGISDKGGQTINSFLLDDNEDLDGDLCKAM